MSVIPGGSHDLRLASDEDSPPTTAINLVLAEDEEGGRRWKEIRVAPLPPPKSEGELQWTNRDPRVDYVLAKSDWSGGALQPVWRSDEPNKYARNDGCDPRWENLLTIGMDRTPADFLVRNGGAEQNATTGWTVGSNVTHTIVTTSPRSGSYVHQLVLASASSAAGTLMYQDLAFHATPWRGTQVTVTVWVKRTGGSDSGIILRVGDGNSNTDSSASTSSSWARLAVTHTVHASSSDKVRIELRNSADPTADHTFHVDDISVTPTGGVTWVGTAEVADTLYAAVGRGIVKWNETNDVWDLVFYSANAATDIIEYFGNIYVATGAGNAYLYGTGTTWTSSNDAASNDAVYFTVNRNRLWKSDSTYLVRSSISPINGTPSSSIEDAPAGSNWSAAYTVGDSDRSITALYNLWDTIVVGKEDGMHIFKRYYNDGTDANEFENITNDYESLVSPDNFARGATRAGWLYLASSQQGLIRFNTQTIEDISDTFFEPRLSSIGGRPWAFAADPTQMWMLVDTPTADTSTSKTVWLASLRLKGEEWRYHLMQTVPIGDINYLSANRGYLYGLGRLYDGTAYVAASYRWTLPTKNVAPAYDASPAILASASIEDPVWDGQSPDADKAYLSVSIICEDLDAEHTIRMRYGLDGAAPTTTTLATFNGSARVQTAYFNTVTTPESAAIGRTIQPEWTFTTDDEVSPKMFAYAIHSTLRPERVRAWECFVWIGDSVPLRNGFPEPVAKANMVSALDTLETQVYPLVLTHDFDQVGAETTVRVHILALERQPEDSSQAVEGMEVWRLVLQEANTS